MKKIITFLMILNITVALAQQSADVKNAIDTFNTGQMDNGITMMNRVVEKESTMDNWDLLVEMYYRRYEVAKDPAQQFKAILGIKPLNASDCYNDLINSCRKAGLYSESPYASIYLREFFVDYYPDSLIGKDAQDLREQAEEFFGKKNYKNAKSCYQKAIALAPNFYKANLYLGDCYWYLNNMDSAIYFFRKGESMHPDLLEPKKYLVDALAEDKKDEEAEKECIAGICVYPDESMYMKLNDLLDRNSKKFDKHWMKRGCEINKIGTDQAKASDKTWAAYQKAKDDMKDYCDKNGIIVKSNKLTKTKYLEVYSFEKMLESPNLPIEFAFAKKMKDEGFLDCYVFISLYHYDFYQQYKDFAKNNKDRISQYINKYLVANK